MPPFGRAIRPSAVKDKDPEQDREEQLDLGDALAYQGYVYRVSTELYMSRRAWLRMVLDRSSFSEETTAEALVAWEKAPGQAAYLGGAIGSEGTLGSLATPTEWQAFAKLAWCS